MELSERGRGHASTPATAPHHPASAAASQVQAAAWHWTLAGEPCRAGTGIGRSGGAGGMGGWGTALQLLLGWLNQAPIKPVTQTLPKAERGEGQPPSCRDAPVGEAERGVGGP